MRAVLMIGVLAVAVPDRPVPDRPEPAPKNENSLQEQLLGEWQLVKITVGNKDLADHPVKHSIIFVRGEIQVMENGQRKNQEDAAYVLNEAKKPATFDIIPKRQGEKKLEGILKIEGDVLTLCMEVMGAGRRPMEFRSNGDSFTALMQLRRVRK
jgi:uncharacterized protein (TIGR03067 family)